MHLEKHMQHCIHATTAHWTNGAIGMNGLGQIKTSNAITYMIVISHLVLGLLASLDEISTYVADLMRYNCITLLISFRPLLLSAGNKVDEVDRMIKNAAEELRDLKARTYVRWRYAWGVRSNTPWTSKPDIPVHDETPPSVIFSEAYKAAKARETTPSPSVTPVSDHLG
ncbi:hypothetical protein FRC02_004074 [Tulasnella sp. 418]|nr:hypothetical protein FRC02_004074 [Tulasnella sp. 418]